MDSFRWFAFIMATVCFSIGLPMKAPVGRRGWWFLIGLLWPISLVVGGILYLCDGFKYLRARI